MTSPLEQAIEALKPFATVGRLIAAGWAGRDVRETDAFQSGMAWRSAEGEAKTLTWGDFTRAAEALAVLQSLPVRPPMKMLVDGDWLSEKVAADPDLDAEAGSLPVREEGGGPTDRDIEWLRDQKETGHCGEGTLESRSRHFLNDRIDRLLASLSSAKRADHEALRSDGWREAAARIIDPEAFRSAAERFAAYEMTPEMIGRRIAAVDYERLKSLADQSHLAAHEAREAARAKADLIASLPPAKQPDLEPQQSEGDA